NRGIAAARGTFIWFVDGDDWLLDDAVDTVLARLRSHLDVLIVNYIRVYEGDRLQASPSADVVAGAPNGTFTLEEWPEIVNVLHVPWNKIFRTDFLHSADIRFASGL